MAAKSDNLVDLYREYQAWQNVRSQANTVFKLLGNQDALAVLNTIDAEIEKCWQRKEALDRKNLQALWERIAGDANYPHSIRTWFEDEFDDLIS